MNYILGQFQINSKELINFENKHFPLIPYETELVTSQKSMAKHAFLRSEFLG